MKSIDSSPQEPELQKTQTLMVKLKAPIPIKLKKLAPVVKLKASIPVVKLKAPAPIVKLKTHTPMKLKASMSLVKLRTKRPAPEIKLKMCMIYNDPIKPDHQYLNDNALTKESGTGQLCEDCGKLHHSKLLKCDACYYKRNSTNSPEIVRCIQCRIVMTDEIRVLNRKSCKKCLALQREKKCKNETEKTECQAICQNGQKCTKKTVDTFKYCAIHLENSSHAKIAIIDADKSIEAFDNYLNQVQAVKILEYYTTNVDSSLNILKQSLIRDISKLREYEPTRIEQIRKYYEIAQFKQIKPTSYYHNKIFNPFKQFEQNPQKLIDNLELELEIIPRYCDIKSKDKPKIDLLNNMWDYFRIHTSSIATPRNKGRHIRALIRDKTTQTYLGILVLGSDFLFLKPLDRAIGWTTNEKINNGKINYLVNIICCVGLRPASYNLNIGKLIAMASFSQELQMEHYRRYGHYYACVDTLSIYGKSIQYDRLKCLKFIKDGYTKGFGSDIPAEIYQQGMKYLKMLGYDLTRYNNMSSARIRKIQLLFKELGMDLSLVFNNCARGIYYGYTASDAQAFLCGKFNDDPNYVFKPIMKPFKNICQEWKECYASKRLSHLIETNRLMTELDLYQGLNRLSQVNMAVHTYRANMEEKFGSVTFKTMEHERDKLYYWKNKYLEIHQFDQQKYQNVPDLTASYLGGIFDGDGSLIIQRVMNEFQMNIQLPQYTPEILEILQIKFGGIINKRPLKEKHRYQYIWRLMGSHCYPFLKLLMEGCILKYKQTQICHDFHEFINKPEQIENQSKLWMLNSFYNENISDSIKESSIKTHEYNSELDVVYIDKLLEKEKTLPSRLNYKYIAGLFDAEGCVTVNNPQKTNSCGMRLKLSHANHPVILYRIQNFLDGCGVVSKCQKYWEIYNSDKIKDKLLDQLIEHSIVKQKQLMALKKYYNTYDKSKTFDEKHTIQLECWQLLKEDKREIVNQSKKLITNSIKPENPYTPDTPVKLQTISQTAQIRKKEHSLKISIAQQKRLGFSEEEQKLMRTLYSDGKNFIEISKITGRDRNAIAKFLKHESPESRALQQQEEADQLSILKSKLSTEEFTEYKKNHANKSKLKISPSDVLAIIGYNIMTKPDGKSYSITEVEKIFQDQEKTVTRNMISNYWKGDVPKCITSTDLAVAGCKVTYDKWIKFRNKQINVKELFSEEMKINVKIV